jgi:hypothetical protein
MELFDFVLTAAAAFFVCFLILLAVLLTLWAVLSIKRERRDK